MDIDQTTLPRKLRGLGRSLSVEKTTPSPQALRSQGKPERAIEDGTENIAPDPIKSPKAFSFTERYMSPTDRILSPVSKGLLARNRKIGMLLPPTRTPTKTMDDCFQDAGFQI